MLTLFTLDQINPLRGLTQQRLIEMFELSQQGYFSRLQWLYHHIEKRDPMVRATKRRLLSALGQLDWDIKLADTGNDADKKAMAELQAETLRSAYDAICNLRDALNFLCLADLRGFSHLEKIYARSGAGQAVTNQTSNIEPQTSIDPWSVIELRIVEQWFWCRRGMYGPWQYNAQAMDTNFGTSINAQNFIIREVNDPVDEIFAEFFVKRRVNDQDWDGFLEDYGVPPMFITMPANVPPDKEKEYQTVAEQAVSRRRGALPNGATLESPNAGASGGAAIFKERLEYIDQQIVIAGTSGLLTVLAVSGSGTLAGDAQKKAFDQITDAIAAGVSEVLQEQFDKPLLARLHQNEPVLAYFQFARSEGEELTAVLDDAKTAADAGFAVDEEQLSEKTGLKLRYVGKGSVAGPADGENLTPAKPGDPNQPAKPQEQTSNLKPQPSNIEPAKPAVDPEQLNTLLQSGLQQFFAAESADLEPLRRALESAIADPTPGKLQALLDELPALQSKLGDSSAEVLRNILGTALAQGLSA